MLIETTHEAISKLSRILPNSFVFAIDTTDRTFLFKSSGKSKCQDVILKLDRDMGIDKMVKKQGYLIQNFNSREVGIRYLGTNTYVGYCLEEPKVGSKSLSLAHKVVVS